MDLKKLKEGIEFTTKNNYPTNKNNLILYGVVDSSVGYDWKLRFKRMYEKFLTVLKSNHEFMRGNIADRLVNVSLIHRHFDFINKISADDNNVIDLNNFLKKYFGKHCLYQLLNTIHDSKFKEDYLRIRKFCEISVRSNNIIGSSLEKLIEDEPFKNKCLSKYNLNNNLNRAFYESVPYLLFLQNIFGKKVVNTLSIGYDKIVSSPFAIENFISKDDIINNHIFYVVVNYNDKDDIVVKRAIDFMTSMKSNKFRVHKVYFSRKMKESKDLQISDDKFVESMYDDIGEYTNLQNGNVIRMANTNKGKNILKDDNLLFSTVVMERMSKKFNILMSEILYRQTRELFNYLSHGVNTNYNEFKKIEYDSETDKNFGFVYKKFLDQSSSALLNSYAPIMNMTKTNFCKILNY